MQIKRRFSRWQVEKEAQINIAGSLKFSPCIVYDISYMGARVTLTVKLPKDTAVKMLLALTESVVLEIEAWVVWQKHIDGHYTYGFYFTKIRDADKEKIYRYVLQYLPQEVARKIWDVSLEPKGGETMEDRRIFARFSARMGVRFLNLKENREGLAETTDISAKGIGLEAIRDIPAQTPLELWLEVPDKGEPLYTRGTVAWSKQVEPDRYRIGVNLEKADMMGMSRVLRAA